MYPQHLPIGQIHNGHIITVILPNFSLPFKPETGSNTFLHQISKPIQPFQSSQQQLDGTKSIYCVVESKSWKFKWTSLLILATSEIWRIWGYLTYEQDCNNISEINNDELVTMKEVSNQKHQYIKQRSHILLWCKITPKWAHKKLIGLLSMCDPWFHVQRSCYSILSCWPFLDFFLHQRIFDVTSWHWQP